MKIKCQEDCPSKYYFDLRSLTSVARQFMWVNDDKCEPHEIRCSMQLITCLLYICVCTPQFYNYDPVYIYMWNYQE